MASAAEPEVGLPPAFWAASEPIAELVEQVRASVVQVRVHGRGGGAGVVWDADGGIVTNQHVVGDEPGPVEVVLHDERVAVAAIVRRHPAADLALLQAPAGGLQPARAGDSDGLRVGELVVAIGHPWGRRGVATAGIVSGTGRTPVHWGGGPVDVIRSDVQLAPGNSGGPLVNARGEVVGINSMIWGGDLSVAIPSRTVQRWLARGPAGRAYLGAELRPVELRRRWGRAAGLLVFGLREAGPADRAGLLLGDVVVGLDGAAVGDPGALAEALADHRPDELVSLDVVRGGIVRRLEITLGAAPPT